MYINYVHTNRVNCKSYVGWATVTEGQTPHEAMMRRWKEHCEYAKNGQQFLLSRALRKYGEDVWDHEVLEIVSTLKFAKHMEVLWIVQRRTYAFDEGNHGYNMTRGGDGTNGLPCSDETREKRRVGRLGVKASEQTILRQSSSQKKRFADPVKYAAYRASIAHRDSSYASTSEYAEKIRTVHLGRKRSKETGERISMSLKMRNARLSDEQKCAISSRLMGNKCAKRCPIVRLDNDGNVEAYYETTYAAAASIGKKSPSAIIACCKGRIHSAQGYVWKYAVDEDKVFLETNSGNKKV